MNDPQKTKSRKYSIIDGAATSAMSGIGDPYIAPFAMELQASNLQTGLLSSLGSLLSPLSQLLGSRLIEKYSRRKIIIYTVPLQAAMWFVFAYIGWWFTQHGASGYLVPSFIISFILYSSLGSVGGPAWFSLLGDLVPPQIRDSYFSRRNKISGLFSLCATLLASIALYYGKNWNFIGTFIILFSIAGLARLIAAYFLYKHYDPGIKLSADYHFSFLDFVRRAPFNNFGKFSIYIAVMQLTINIANPYLAVYMWKELKFDPISFSIVSMASGLFLILSMSYWGKFSKHYGNKELLRIGSFIIAISPIFWIFSHNTFYLALIPQLLFGLGWGAFTLSASNFIYDAVTPERRAICITYHNILSGLGAFIGASIGGVILTRISLPSAFNVFFVIFLLSGILRLIVANLFVEKIKEVRENVTPPKERMLSYFLDREWMQL